MLVVSHGHKRGPGNEVALGGRISRQRPGRGSGHRCGHRGGRGGRGRS